MINPLHDHELDAFPPAPAGRGPVPPEPFEPIELWIGPAAGAKAEDAEPAGWFERLGVVDAIGLGLLAGLLVCGLAMLAVRPTPGRAAALAAFLVLPPLLWRVGIRRLLDWPGRAARRLVARTGRLTSPMPDLGAIEVDRAPIAALVEALERHRRGLRAAGAVAALAIVLAGGVEVVARADRAFEQQRHQRARREILERRGRVAADLHKHMLAYARMERESLEESTRFAIRLEQLRRQGDADPYLIDGTERLRKQLERRAASVGERRRKYEEALARAWDE